MGIGDEAVIMSGDGWSVSVRTGSAADRSEPKRQAEMIGWAARWHRDRHGNDG